MRLLNISSVQLEKVPDSELDTEKYQYAILSHGSGFEEVEASYKDMVSVNPDFNDGFNKLRKFCEVALKAGFQYAWIEPCCVNKESSVEQNETFNSMYLWYSRSKICIAYLDDVDGSQNTWEDSEWFNSAWTLQALIASKDVAFFDRNWIAVGTKRDLLATLSTKTGIPEEVLGDPSKVSTCSVAQRMSWMSRRTTERVEDRAYSLLGLFDVHMPILYGEREKAFLRLQQHIAQKTADESLFAWSMGQFEDTSMTYSGLYAPSPSNFRDCSNIVSIIGSKGFSERNGYLSLKLPQFSHSPGLYQALLHCAPKSSLHKRVYIVLAKTGTPGEYVRVRDCKGKSMGFSSLSPRPEDWRQMSFVLEPKTPPETIFFGFWLRTLNPPGYSGCETTVLSSCETSEKDYVRQVDRNSGNTGIVRFKPLDASESPGSLQIQWLKFGFDNCCNPVIWLANDSQSERLEATFEQAAADTSRFSRVLQNEDGVMKGDIEDKISCDEGSPYFKSNDIVFGWPSGRAVVKVDQTKGLRRFAIQGLNLSISVVLQPFHSPVNSSCKRENGEESQPTPTKIWTVDITPYSEAAIGSLTPEVLVEIPEFRWLRWLWLLPWYPCALDCIDWTEEKPECNPCYLASCGYWVPKSSKGPNLIDCCYPFYRKRMARKVVEARMEEVKKLQVACESAASFEIPLLVSSSEIKRGTEGYGNSANCLVTRIVPNGTRGSDGRAAVKVPPPMYDMWAKCFG
ncbi:hypothetical protein HD806DRAFT_517226 [Xylariaceae sp. AK1471]|nr:hypothetical protein HD806DRAFT_517226 [Xylariaceae sp. AK1471]